MNLKALFLKRKSNLEGKCLINRSVNYILREFKLKKKQFMILKLEEKYSLKLNNKMTVKEMR